MTELVPAHPPALPTHPDDVVLPGTAERIRGGVADNTLTSYRRVWGQFEDWCAEHGRSPRPTSSATLADYVAHLADQGKAPATLKHAMGVISAQNQMAGFPALGKETTKAANLVLRGHRRDRAAEGDREDQAAPITRELLQRMVGVCDPLTLAGKRNRLLLVLGWCVAARRSELAALHIEDVRQDPEGLEVFFRMSKTDKDAEGETTPVPHGDHVNTDPVGLLNAWLEALDEAEADNARGPLFRAITQHDRLFKHGSLTDKAINNVVQRIAKKSGLPNWADFSGHSMRSGFATQAAMDGIPVSIWARHGRWDPESPVPLRYVRSADRKRDNPLKKMGL